MPRQRSIRTRVKRIVSFSTACHHCCARYDIEEVVEAESCGGEICEQSFCFSSVTIAGRGSPVLNVLLCSPALVDSFAFNFWMTIRRAPE